MRNSLQLLGSFVLVRSADLPDATGITLALLSWGLLGN